MGSGSGSGKVCPFEEEQEYTLRWVYWTSFDPSALRVEVTVR